MENMGVFAAKFDHLVPSTLVQVSFLLEKNVVVFSLHLFITSLLIFFEYSIFIYQDNLNLNESFTLKINIIFPIYINCLIIKITQD